MELSYSYVSRHDDGKHVSTIHLKARRGKAISCSALTHAFFPLHSRIQVPKVLNKKGENPKKVIIQTV